MQLVKHNNLALYIEKNLNESNDEFNARSIFVLKNLDQKKYPIEDVIELSHIYRYKRTLKCVYSEEIEEMINQLSANIYINLRV